MKFPSKPTLNLRRNRKTEKGKHTVGPFIRSTLFLCYLQYFNICTVSEKIRISVTLKQEVYGPAHQCRSLPPTMDNKESALNNMVRGPKVVCVLIAHHNTYAQISINLNRVLIFHIHWIRLPLFLRRSFVGAARRRLCCRLCTQVMPNSYCLDDDKARISVWLDVECCVVSLGHKHHFIYSIQNGCDARIFRQPPLPSSG